MFHFERMVRCEKILILFRRVGKKKLVKLFIKAHTWTLFLIFQLHGVSLFPILSSSFYYPTPLRLLSFPDFCGQMPCNFQSVFPRWKILASWRISQRFHDQERLQPVILCQHGCHGDQSCPCISTKISAVNFGKLFWNLFFSLNRKKCETR